MKLGSAGSAIEVSRSHPSFSSFRIWKALRILFTAEERGEAWIRRPNEFFDGASALEIMLQGGVADIYRVRQYLDSQRGG